MMMRLIPRELLLQRSKFHGSQFNLTPNENASRVRSLNVNESFHDSIVDNKDSS